MQSTTLVLLLCKSIGPLPQCLKAQVQSVLHVDLPTQILFGELIILQAHSTVTYRGSRSILFSELVLEVLPAVM